MRKLLLLIVLIITGFTSVAQNPVLWGIMRVGGTLGQGTIYRINGDGTNFTVAHAMGAGSSQGSLVLHPNGSFYGLTVAGGGSANGTIFKYDPVGNTYTTLFSFNSSDGFYPRASLFLATDGNFYGMTSQGGLNNQGTFFQFNPVTIVFNKILDFGLSNGNLPNGNVVQSGNKIYGMTTNGGSSPLSGGVIFSYDIITNQYFVVHNFLFATGFTPFGSLIKGSNGLLYGMAFGGGGTGHGVIFSLDPSSNNYNVLHNFDGVNGAAPNGALVQSGTSNIFYGFTQQGGVNNKGVIFSFEISGNNFSKLYDFDTASGSSPNGSPIVASNGKIYGHASSGGSNSLGGTFSFDPVSNVFNVLYSGSFANGGFPDGDLIENNIPLTSHELAVTSFVNVFPNPVSTDLHIELPAVDKQIEKVSIYTLDGKLMTETYLVSSDDIRIPVATLTSGSYHVVVTTSAMIYRQGFIKH